MVGIFSKDCYISFLKEVANFITNDNYDINKVKEPFTKYISESNEAFDLFASKLPVVKEELEADLDFFMISDPAILSKEEVIYAYPGFKAICCYRIAHALYEIGLKLEARMISELAHSLTGIDIHPAARIASPFFIDHGTGIVIGETTEISSHVKMYQGVTLGALSLSNIEKVKGKKRHPTIEENVTIYACASILGDVTIGNDSVIGANVFLTEDVASFMKVTIGKPDLVIKEKNH